MTKKYTFQNIKSLRKLKIVIITLSDRASSGEYEDISGPTIKGLIETYLTKKGWYFETDYSVMPDDSELLSNKIKENFDADMIFTTGGTGVGARDITPETVEPLLDKVIPGIMEMIRVKYGMKIPNAVLSRGIAGFAGSYLAEELLDNGYLVTGAIYPGESTKNIDKIASLPIILCLGGILSHLDCLG